MKHSKISKECRENWSYLIEHFTADYIENEMEDKDEYVIGKANHYSFCYLVEAGTKELGDIRGSSASKFGLWYGVKGKDNTKEYRTTKKVFKGNTDIAFSMLKAEVARVIRKSEKMTSFKDTDSFLTSMFKYKIMYLYNPEKMLPSFVLEDLQYFEDCLGLPVSQTFEKAQKEMLNYKNENYPTYSNHDVMIWLYKKYGRNKASVRKINDEQDNALNEALNIPKKDTGKSKDKKTKADKYVTHPVEKASLKSSSEVQYYPRDINMAKIALENANYKCEINNCHCCFIRKSNGKPYTEVHHLIPLAYHYKFKNSLDIPENIVSLCSSCHNEIHYGENADKLIEKLFNERKDKLHKAGIDIELKDLLDMYHKIHD